MLARLYCPVWSFLKSEDGPTSVEYAFMIGLIIVVVFTTVTTVGSNTTNSLSYTGTRTRGVSS